MSCKSLPVTFDLNNGNTQDGLHAIQSLFGTCMQDTSIRGQCAGATHVEAETRQHKPQCCNCAHQICERRLSLPRQSRSSCLRGSGMLGNRQTHTLDGWMRRQSATTFRASAAGSTLACRPGTATLLSSP